MQKAVVVKFNRTAFGEGRKKDEGTLSKTHATDISALVLDDVVNGSIEAGKVENVLWGCVTPIKSQGTNVGRASIMAANFPIEVPGSQLNTFCGSGLDAINRIAMGIMSGQINSGIGGGVEMMSVEPMGSDGAFPPVTPKVFTKHNLTMGQGFSADLIAQQEGFTREECDAFSMDSNRKYFAGKEKGFYNDILPVPLKEGAMTEDEHPRMPVPEKIASLNLAFDKKAGTHTAASASGVVDGSAAMLLVSDALAKAEGLTIQGEIIATALVGSDPRLMLTGPVPAMQKAMKIAGITADDLNKNGIVEINEAFAAVPMYTIKHLGLDPAIVNIYGGAIAHGHPLGATGCAILGKAIKIAKEQGKEFAAATLCIGFGMGIATIVRVQ